MHEFPDARKIGNKEGGKREKGGKKEKKGEKEEKREKKKRRRERVLKPRARKRQSGNWSSAREAR